MSSEVATEVPFTRRKRTKLGQYWATMGFIFQIIRDIDPKLKYLIDTFTLLGLIWSTKTIFSLAGSTLNGKCQWILPILSSQFFLTLCWFSLIKGLRVFVWSRLWRLNLKKKYGEWVVITGATDGIGLEYAREFASRGHSLILVGRNETKLENVKRQLSSLISSNKIVTIQADFNDSTPEVSVK